jgi:uncharacterized membrane protein YgcG
MNEPTDKEQYLSVADQCAATASNDITASILVDGGSGTLRQLLNDAADAIRAGWRAQPTAEGGIKWQCGPLASGFTAPHPAAMTLADRQRVPDDKPASYEFIILIVTLVGLGSIYFVWMYISEKKRLEEIERERERMSREYDRISRERERARLSRPISENPAPIVPIAPAKKAEPVKKTEPVKKAEPAKKKEPEPESTYVAPVFSSDDRSSSWMTSSISDISSFSSSDSSSYDGGGSSRSWGD